MGTVSGLISVLNAEVGIHEGRDGDGTWNNHQKYSPAVPGLEWSQDQPWCATFATWAYQHAGVKAGTFPVTASVFTAMEWYKAHGRWSEYPSVGAQVIFGSNVHTGIVIGFNDTEIFTIEGNTNVNGSANGDGVYKRTRPRKVDFVTGYGSPDFDNASVPAPKPVPKPTPHYAPFPGEKFFYIGRQSDIITKMGQALVRAGYKGYKFGPSREFTRADIKAVAWFQQKQGWSGDGADGYPGPETWKRLKVSA